MAGDSASTKWKVTTGVLAVACAVLIAHALTRPAAIPVRTNTIEVRVPVPAQQPTPRHQPPAAEPPPQPEVHAATPTDPQTAVAEFRLENLALGERLDVDVMRAALAGREEEAIAQLERWLRRADEIDTLHIGATRWLTFAYAELAGARALPLLSELRKSARSGVALWAVEGLMTIDTDGAIAELRRAQEEAPERRIVDPRALAHHGGRCGTLLRDWAFAPPAEVPWMGTKARFVLFRVGTNEERARIWRSAEGEAKYRLAGVVAHHVTASPSEWASYAPELREYVRKGLDAPDQVMRARALVLVTLAPTLFSKDVQQSARRQVQSEAETSPPDDPSEAKVARDLLRQAETFFDAADESEERRQRMLELLEVR